MFEWWYCGLADSADSLDEFKILSHSELLGKYLVASPIC